MPYSAKVVAPLYKLLGKNVKWILSLKHAETMHALQKALSSPLVLYLPNFQKAIQLGTDTSDFAIGSVLS